VLYRFVAQINLDRAGIDALIDELLAAGMAQHVRMDFQPRLHGRTELRIGSVQEN